MADEEFTRADRPAAATRSRGSKVLGWFFELVLIVVGALVISALLRGFVGQMFIIPSGSMEKTLMVGDRVLVSKIGGFQRGDIVVFEDPGGWMPTTPDQRGAVGQALEFIGLLPNSSTNHLIKRVIGMPGDKVECCDAEGRIKVNGVALDESAYLYTDDSGVQVAPANVPFEVVVPKGRIFVLGDHRNSSGDSRCHLSDISQQGPPGMVAFVPIDKVVGATVAVVAPLDRLQTIKLPGVFASVPAAEGDPPELPGMIRVNPGC